MCKDSEEKKHSDTEDLLEDLGRATDKVIEQQKQTKKYFHFDNFSFSAIIFRTGQEEQRLDKLLCLKDFDYKNHFLTLQTFISLVPFQVRRDSLKVVELVRWFDFLNLLCSC